MRTQSWQTSARATAALLASVAVILGASVGATADQRTVIAELFAGSG